MNRNRPSTRSVLAVGAVYLAAIVAANLAVLALVIYVIVLVLRATGVIA